MAMESLAKVIKAKFDNPALHIGDQVRLKFLYPAGDVEIVDGIWLGVSNLDPTGEGESHPWVVVQVGERMTWKPLPLVVQIEVLSKGTGGEAGEVKLDPPIQYYR